MAKNKNKKFLDKKITVTVRILIFVQIFAAISAFTIWKTLAVPPTKGGGGGNNSINLGPIVVDNNGDGLPNYNDTITFNISTTVTTEPWVELVCSQNGAIVLDGWKGYFDRSLTTRNFTLASNGWTSGAADCTAYLESYSSKGKGGYTHLASTTFHVNP